MEFENDGEDTRMDAPTRDDDVEDLAMQQGEEEKDSEAELGPSSPIPKDRWPADSLLTREHFTLDNQRCLVCEADLGYQMPMNRTPKPKYLFCPTGLSPNCFISPVYKCLSCGHFSSSNQGDLVSRPANSGYDGPAECFSFMCTYCYNEQKAGEPGLQETKEAMAAFREVRRQADDLELEKYERLAAGGRTTSRRPTHAQRLKRPSQLMPDRFPDSIIRSSQQLASGSSSSGTTDDSFISEIPEPRIIKSRKRLRFSELPVEEERENGKGKEEETVFSQAEF